MPGADDTGPLLTIGVVAAQSGIEVATLRSWEQRHGFPEPVRTPSGHRRYTTADIEQIREVVRQRDDGLSLERAVARIRERSSATESSLYAGVRRRHPDLPVHVLSTRAMTAISRAIEDECCAQAGRAVLIGSFQRARSYRASETRWTELARTALVAVVLADFGGRARRARRSGPIEVDVPSASAIGREWAVVCQAPDAAACVVGVELPSRGDGIRRFEAVWSVEPRVVADAVAIAVAAALAHGASIGELGAGTPTTDPTGALRSAAAVTSRVVAYLDRWN